MTNSRRKGHNFERLVAQRYRDALGTDDVRRGQQAHGAREPDVVAPRVWTECKVGPRPNPRAALDQATDNAQGSGLMPIAIVRDNGAGRRPAADRVVMWLDDWMRLYTALVAAGWPTEKGRPSEEIGADGRPGGDD